MSVAKLSAVLFAALSLGGCNLACTGSNGEYTAQQREQIRDAAGLVQELGGEGEAFIILSGYPLSVGSVSYLGSNATVFARVKIQPKDGGLQPITSADQE